MAGEAAFVVGGVVLAVVEVGLLIAVEDWTTTVEATIGVVDDDVVLLGGKIENWLDCARMAFKFSVSCTKLRRKPCPVGQPKLGGLRVTCSRVPSTSADKICLTLKSWLTRRAVKLSLSLSTRCQVHG